SAAMVVEVHRIAKHYDEAFDAFIRFAFGEVSAEFLQQGNNEQLRHPTDAMSEFEDRFASQIESMPIWVRADAMRTRKGPLPREMADQLEEIGVGFTLDKYVLQRVAERVKTALMRIGSGQIIDPERDHIPGFVPGRAFETFLIELREWANTFGLPKAYRTDGNAGALARLSFSLICYFPKELQTNVISANAIYDRYRRARKSK
ncbi:MAG: hypothetical protein KDK27_19955, partial [Leptospiraceae bacterium]|nr:hypothetical protein [Leptospiraceae bacterium]